MIATTTNDNTPRERRNDVALMAIIFVASAVTIWWQTQNHFQFNADSVSYVENAMRLSFCDSGYHCCRGPGYPLLIALTGVPLLNTFLILRVVQALMSVGIVVLIYQTLRPFHRRAALIAASLAMFSAIPWVYSTMVMTEQLYLFVLCLFFFFASRSFDIAQPHRLRYFYVATFTIFELTIIKSSAAAFFVIWLAVAGLILRKPRHLAYAAALYFSLMIGWSLVDNIALSRGAKVRSMGSLAKTEFAEAYYSGWMKVFERYQGEPDFISAERGPASRELYDVMLRYVYESPGNWLTLTPHDLWGVHAENPAQLAEDLFAKPSQSYCEFICRSVHARLGRKAANALFHRVAGEYILTGVPRVVSNISLGVPTRYLGQAIFYHAYHCIDPSIIGPENGPATRQLIEAAKQHFVMDTALWQEAYDRDTKHSSPRVRPVLSADMMGEIVFDRWNERYWELLWIAAQELYGLEGSDKLLRDVAIEAFSEHPDRLTYVLETARMFVGFERNGELPSWSNLEELPYLNSHTQWLDEPLRSEVQGQLASLPVVEKVYGAMHALRLWLLLAALISIPLTYRNRPVFRLVVIMMAVSLCHGAICVCFSNFSARNCDPMFLSFIVVAACGMSEIPHRLSRYRRSSGHMNDLISMPRFEALPLANLDMPAFPEHAATNDPSNEFDLTLFVACYNEEANIVDTLDTLIAALRECNLTWEILIIDDGSRDHSVEMVRQYIEAHPQTPITLKVNGTNKGLAQNYIEGAFLGRGKYYRLVCGDNVEPKETFVKIFKQIGAADMLIPYHVVCPGRSRGRVVLSRVFTKLVNFITGYRLHYYNGMAVLMRYQVMRWHTNYHGFGFQADMVTRLLDQGFSWIEIPVAGQERKAGASKALTLKNLLSVSHMFLDLIIRRIAKIMYPPPHRRVPDYVISNVHHTARRIEYAKEEVAA